MILASVLLALAGCSEQPEGEPIVRTEFDGAPDVAPSEEADEAEASPKGDIAAACRQTSFDGVKLTHCIADPAKHRIACALAPSSGEKFGTIEAWAAGKNEGDIAFVMNAGMYGDDLKSIGYFVRDKERLQELNRADGSGNFFMKPNGVFFGSNGKWRVLPTETFYRSVGDRPQFGTQSGPMLVIDGKLHPDFQEDGPSRQIRNGVGVDSEGKAHFVISDVPLSFGKFARFFRDALKTPNALYLDGNVSSLWHPESGRMDQRRVGPLIVVTKREDDDE